MTYFSIDKYEGVAIITQQLRMSLLLGLLGVTVNVAELNACGIDFTRFFMVGSFSKTCFNTVLLKSQHVSKTSTVLILNYS